MVLLILILSLRLFIARLSVEYLAKMSVVGTLFYDEYIILWRILTHVLPSYWKS